MKRVATGLVLAALLTSCSSGSPAADLQSSLNAVIDAANAKDPAGLRAAAGRFEQEVAAQSANGDITATRAQDLRTVAERVLQDANLLEPAPSPPPSSAPPAPSPSPSPTPTPTPPPSSAPPSPSPIIVPPPLTSPTPAGSPSP